MNVLTCQLKLCHWGTADRLEVAFSLVSEENEEMRINEDSYVNQYI